MLTEPSVGWCSEVASVNDSDCGVTATTSIRPSSENATQSLHRKTRIFYRKCSMSENEIVEQPSISEYCTWNISLTIGSKHQKITARNIQCFIQVLFIQVNSSTTNNKIMKKLTIVVNNS